MSRTSKSKLEYAAYAEDFECGGCSRFDADDARDLALDLIDVTAQKDGAYSERDQVVAAFARLALASGLKAWTARHVGDPWDDDWRGIVFIELPTGQASWHYHDSEHHLFADLPTIGAPWDGHDTPEKYRRMKAATYMHLANPLITVPDSLRNASLLPGGHR